MNSALVDFATGAVLATAVIGGGVGFIYGLDRGINKATVNYRFVELHSQQQRVSCKFVGHIGNFTANIVSYCAAGLLAGALIGATSPISFPTILYLYRPYALPSASCQ